MNYNTFVFDLQKEHALTNELVGGKGSNLCMINKISGINVPGAFCVSTDAYRHCIMQNPLIYEMIRKLSEPDITEEQTKEAAQQIRRVIETIQLPTTLVNEITNELGKYQDQQLFAIRSSATAEDLPSASFAGQHDSFLNIKGTDAILTNILKCWSSLFTDRAISYRTKNNIDHLKVSMAVVVQQMVHPTASGVMFTADPVSSNRKELTIEAVKGYGDIFVSGEVNADSYRVSEGVISKPKMQGIENKILTDSNIVELTQIGRTIEAYFGVPQDIEWCYADDRFYIVQSRPITTLFPIPETKNKGLRVYLSTGHQQMMTDAMKPLGISIFAASSGQYMHNAAGRIFYDTTDHLSSPSRNMILNVIGKSEILMRDALQSFLNKYDQDSFSKPAAAPPVTNFDAVLDNDPSVIDELISHNEKSLQLLKQNIKQKKGAALIDFILEDILQRKKDIVDSRNMAALTTSMNTAAWLNENLNQWLGLKNVADTLTQSAPNNVTSEMGLALLDVADTIRGKAELIKYLESIQPSNTNNVSIEKIKEIPGGEECYYALSSFLEKYGMRCVGEIDISRPRWIEEPYILIPFLLSNVKNFESGEAERKFNTGLATAESKKQEIIALLQQLPDGAEKARLTAEKISLLRNFAGYREYPKYAYICRYLEYKKMLVKEAEVLVNEKLLYETEDLFYLSLEEIKSLIISKNSVKSLIDQRKQDFKQYEKLTPPRVITSDGEIFRGEYSSKDLPENAIPGLAVSSGIAEGRARVIANFSDAKLEEGDILVTTFTDPSWTPAFVSISALVTEVGGLMTHGAVIAREYGLPAVVGVENATRLIRDGQRIRVNGTEGIVELITNE